MLATVVIWPFTLLSTVSVDNARMSLWAGLEIVGMDDGDYKDIPKNSAPAGGSLR